jgi:hypothetical protein
MGLEAVPFLEGDQLIHGRAGYDVIEGEDGVKEMQEDLHDVLAPSRDDAVPDTVIDLRGDGLALAQELGDDALLGLAPPLVAEKGRVREAERGQGAFDLVLGQAEEIAEADRAVVEEFPAVDVVDDVHRLEDAAGLGLEPAFATRVGGRAEEIQDAGGVLEGLEQIRVDLELQLALEIGDGLRVDRPEAVQVLGATQVELVDPQKIADLVVGPKTQTGAVDHRTALEHELEEIEILGGKFRHVSHL